MRRIVVFARAPRAGAVKTRLAADVGPERALRIYRMLGERAVAAARAVPDAYVEVHYTPAGDRTLVVDWLGVAHTARMELHAQANGSLGDRMRAAIDGALVRGASAVAVIGTDCPELDADVIERAFTALAEADVVLGPAEDGGYYLVAVRARHAALFTGIPWSSHDTLRCTLEAAERAALRVTLLKTLMDIDRGADWQRWAASRSQCGDGSPL